LPAPGGNKKKVYDGTINGIKISAESAFYELLKARENVRIAENALQRADEQVKIAQTKVQIGSGSNVDLIGVQASQAAARATLVSAQNTAKLKLMDLNKTMGVDLEAQYNLTGSFEFKKEEFKLQDLLDKALSEEVGLIAAQDACDIATWTYEFQKLFYSSRSYDVKSSEHDKIAAELTLKQTHDNLITSVTENYYSYLALEEKYQYLQKALELQKETYRLKKLSYEVGMATSEDVMQASDNVEVAEYNLTDCIFSYNLLKSSFKYNTYN
jgi:outer membrane protein TolC